MSYLANVDEAAHQVLIAERVDGRLRLLPCSVFNNTRSLSVKDTMFARLSEGLTRIPITPSKVLSVNYHSKTNQGKPEYQP